MAWKTINTDSQITAIHAALLMTEPDGVIVYFGDWAAPSGTIEVQELTHTRLYRLAPNLPQPIVAIADDAVPTTDAFCCGQSFLADGRLLAGGGTFGWANAHMGIHAEHYDGERACWMYLPRLKRWLQVKDLAFQPGSNTIGGGRWYPTLVTLGNGEVFAVGGHPSADDLYPPDPADKRHNNNTPERYSPGANTWTLMTDDITAPDGFAFATDGYPRYHVMPNGLLFSDTAGKDTRRNPGDPVTSQQRLFDPFAGKWTNPAIAGLESLPTFYSRGSEASSVLLPLMPPNYGARILTCNSGDATAFRIDVNATPTWQATTPRTGAAANRRRDNACATLLPTGQVLVTGGWPGNYNADDPAVAVREPELYTPGIDWDLGDFSKTDEEKWVTLDEPAPNRRGYHSTALLMPDGRVWVGGSTTKAEQQNRNIDIFEPAYVNDANRPTIGSCPDNIAYTMVFPVTTPQANTIARVALMRCGAITHGFNTDQRQIILKFTVKDANTLSVAAPPHGNIAPPGNYMLFLIDNQERVCQRAAFIRVSRQKLVISADISTFSIHEVEALGTPAQFTDALFVLADGFLPSEVTTPSYKLLWTNNDPVPDVTVTFGPPKYEAGSDQPDVAQRVVYPVRITFQDTTAFDAIPADQDFRPMVFYATMGLYLNAVTLQLSKNPNPRMRDGDPSWLSIDLRVFKTKPGASPTAGIGHPSADEGEDGAYGYIKDVLAAYNAAPPEGHPFDGLPTDQSTNHLELGINDANGDPAFNYAVARVRFRAPEGINAVDVRVFFRLWTTGWTALEYNLNTSYRRFGNGPSATPLLGLQGGEINNIPCFAQARAANMETQSDTTNRRTLSGTGATEIYGYFGCWLDVNQDTARFPLKPNGNGPFTDADNPLSIQDLMRGLHQCLVAEIHYQLDPINPGDTPGSSDNLAQRNILFDYSDNPGSFSAHLVHHTFELKSSPFPFPTSEFGSPATPSTTGRVHPDELVIDWGGLPRDSMVTFYMPQVDAEEIVRAAALRQAPGNLQVVGPGTLMCRVTDVGFMPIPGPFKNTIAGLVSVQLPPGVPYGKTYRIVLRQVAGHNYKVLGTTEFRIKVAKAEELLQGFLHNLAILKHIALAIPLTNRWYPVFKRYLAELGDRIRAFGGDPDAVAPSPAGTGGTSRDPQQKPEKATFTGKVVRLCYDCHGAFEGFELRNCEASKFFTACDPAIAQVALTACRENLKLFVVYDPASNRPVRMCLLSC